MARGSFQWDTKQQGIILAAFFYGYTTTQVIGGTLAQRVGGKLLMLFGVFWTALLTLLTPVLTIYGGFPALVAVRVLEGIGEVWLALHCHQLELNCCCAISVWELFFDRFESDAVIIDEYRVLL